MTLGLIEWLPPIPRAEAQMVYKVFLADNQPVFRTGAARIMAVEDDFRIVGQCDDLGRLMKAASSVSGAILMWSASLQADLPKLIEDARSLGSRTIVVLENDVTPTQVIAAGVDGVIHRDVLALDMVRCVRTVGHGEPFVQKRHATAGMGFETDMVSERVKNRLSPKELKILGLILRGYKNKEIAEELHNTEQVIKNYLRSIFNKTGVSDRLELALFTMHHKLLATAATQANESVNSAIV